MNKSLYRIVFNQSRGQLMAVAETAGAQGKSASGETASPNTCSNSFPSRGKAGMGASPHSSPLLSTLSFCIALTLGITLTAPLHVQAQIKADASAPRAQQPVILQTASGITQVDIATPSAAGVSRNTYSQFDVGRPGVILNNSRANVLTQLGGYASGNPMLAAGSARVILNEINSANPSYINGYIEVAGQRAEVIIANPSGININGGGFINASRATLTTGTPVMNGGSLDGYLVQRGNISINGAGLDASTTDYTGILARAVQVNAGIWAKELKVIAGANQINETQTIATPITGTGPAPTFAIDVAQLGGMYAGKITLVGTEAGVGVRNAGVIGATAGDVLVQSNGWLSSISNSGTIYAAGNTSLTAQGNITNTSTGLIAALGNTSLAANGPGAQVITLAGSVLAAGLRADGSLATSGDLSITSTAAAQLKGQFAAGGGIALTSASLDLSDITLAAQNATLKATTGDLDLSRSTVNVSGALTANATQTLRSDGAVVTANQLSLSANRISNVAGQIRQLGTGNANLNAPDAIDNTRGTIASNGALTLTSAGGINNSQGLISATQNATLQDNAAIKTLAITNTAGSIIAGQLASINAASLSGDGKVQSLGDVSIALTGDFNNQSEVVANNNLTFSTTGNVTNSGKLQAGNTLAVSAANITNAAAGEITGRSTTITAASALTNRGLIDGQTTRINAPTLTNIGTGRIYGDDLSIAATALSNDAETVNGVAIAAVIAARNRLDIGATTINNRNGATLLSVGDMAIGGALDANGQATGRASVISNHGATIQSMGNLRIAAQTLNNTNAGFGYAVYDVAGIRETSYNTLYNAYFDSQGAVPSAPLAYYRTAGTGVATYTLNPAAGQGWVAGQLVYSIYRYDITTQRAVVTSTDPGVLSSGGTMNLDASSQINNDMSQILAGTTLGITGNASINNIQNTVATTTTHRGNVYTWGNFDGGGCGRGRCDRWLAYGQSGYYNTVASSTTLQGNYQSNAAARTQAVATPGATTVGALPSRVVINPVAGNGPTNSALFRLNPNPGPASSYLIQTDPRFTNLRTWLSSDYMLQQLNTNPSNILKRLGDGFYEQRLINEQIGQLTGRRFLGNFTSQDQQYQGLMDSGITYARAFNLRPGIALSATQMAQLTSDMVWLVEQTVTLPNGTTTQALVPQVYVANIRPGDIDGAGALLSAQAININVTGDVNNSGTIGGNISGTMNGRTLVSINAANINNLMGNIQGTQVSLSATNDISNTGGAISAGSQLGINAGRDINLLSTTTSNKGSGSPFTRTQVDRLAGVYVVGLGATPGSLNLNAGRDINAQAASIANTSTNGATTLQAARDIKLSTVTTDFAASVGGGANFMRMQTSQDVGTSIATTGDLSLRAGNNINATAATIQSSQGATNLIAGNTISLLAGQKTSDMAWGSETKTSGFLSSSSTTRRETGSSTQAVGTTVGGSSVNAMASKDINIKGSSVISDTTANLTAGNNINIQAAVNTQSQTSFTETKETGFLSGGGFGITYGKRTQSTEQKAAFTTAAASTVGAITGNITAIAGNQYKQVGSDLIAPTGDINISAKKVDIVEARETSSSTTEQKFKQTGLTLSISSPVISAIQQGQGMAQAASQTSSGRMKALAGASTALNVYNNAGDITKSAQALASSNPAAAARITLSLGTSKSQSNSSSKSDTARGSTVGAGRNINITATGDGANSNLLIQGSDVKAGNNTTLTADNKINLLAAKNESSQTSTNSSSSDSLSVSYGAGGWGFGASASKGKGKSDGEDTSFSNTNVSAGNTAIIKSGGDTNVIGAVVEANQIKADIGGNLKIESLQDKSTYSSSQQNVSGSVSVGGGGNGASVSASKSNVDSSFQSVGQQSGLKAGDGGFQVAVNNNTDLKGAVISSTQSAVDSGKNSFTTGGALTITDIQNQASFSGKAVGGTVGVGSQLGSSGAGVGNKSGNAASTSTAGISGIAGNTAVRTGDAETGLKPIFDADKVQKDINAQVAITTAFTQQAGKAVGDYAGRQLKEAGAKKEQAKNTTDPDKREALLKEAADIEGTWGEGKPGRVGLHVIVGALTGNVAGALGAGASQAAIPYIADAIGQLDAPLEVKQALIQVAGGAVGAAVGGASGGASALGITANNYLKHTDVEQLAKKLAACGTTDKACKDAVVIEAKKISDKNDAELLACGTDQSCVQKNITEYVKGAQSFGLLYAADKTINNDSKTKTAFGAMSDMQTTGGLLAANLSAGNTNAAKWQSDNCVALTSAACETKFQVAAQRGELLPKTSLPNIGLGSAFAAMTAFKGPHEYTHTGTVCDGTNTNCTTNSTFNALMQYPGPGSAGTAMVSSGSVSAIGIGPFLLGYVTHLVDPVTQSVVNITMPGAHGLDQGWVARQVGSQPNGITSVNSYGAGTGANPFNINVLGVTPVWGGNVKSDIKPAANLGIAPNNLGGSPVNTVLCARFRDCK